MKIITRCLEPIFCRNVMNAVSKFSRLDLTACIINVSKCSTTGLLNFVLSKGVFQLFHLQVYTSGMQARCDTLLTKT